MQAQHGEECDDGNQIVTDTCLSKFSFVKGAKSHKGIVIQYTALKNENHCPAGGPMSPDMLVPWGVLICKGNEGNGI